MTPITEMCIVFGFSYTVLAVIVILTNKNNNGKE